MYVHTDTESDIAIIQAHCYVVTTSELILMHEHIYTYVYMLIKISSLDNIVI